ncbi:MAG: formylglycine-generating enzyme family protein [Verrucomicrobiales bacterium]|nr:formylglycine-generating enzyme family protein [Verrucomicrobiales bacterium]
MRLSPVVTKRVPLLILILLTVVLPILGAVPEARVVVDSEARISLGQDVSGWRLSYQVSATAGTLRFRASESPGDLRLSSSEFHREPIPSSGFGSIPISATNVARYYAMTWDAEILNPDPTRLVWVSPVSFVMGSPDSEMDRDSDEAPRTIVEFPRGFYLGRFEITQGEFSDLMGTNPSNLTGDPRLPVDNVTWEEAREFARRLTERDRAANRIPAGYEYRLPTEAEWECAARSGTETRFAFGDDPEYRALPDHAWFAGNSDGRPHVVGGRLPNSWGFYDLAGNVGEWCLDNYRDYNGGRLIEPRGSVDGEAPVIRGGSFEDEGAFLRSAFRYYEWTTNRLGNVGFRVALAPVVRPIYEPSLELVWIPPGSFLMGSPETEDDHQSDESPQTHITLTRGFWMGRLEVSQTQFEAWMGFNPAAYPDGNQPVESVTWQEAAKFCAAITAGERGRMRIPRDWEYRLPTEVEWEYAARAGTTSRFSFGNDPDLAELDKYAWSVGAGQPHGVGGKIENPWGLHDMHGNVAEWCLDDYVDYPGNRLVDPAPFLGNTGRNIRGGSFADDGEFLRCAFRFFESPTNRFRNVGFRVVLTPVRGAASQGLPAPEMVSVPAGKFLMGSPDSEADRDPDEGPRTEVSLSRPFAIGRYEITQAQYAGIMGTNPSVYRFHPSLPVQSVTWDQANEFCARLTESERAGGRLPSGQLYRLPTEAEWEYAARAGTTTRFSYGDDPGYNELAANAVYLVAPPRGVGGRPPNAWGLHDVHGNVAEWCLDWYAPYPGESLKDPAGPVDGFWRVLRGGSWDDAGRACRSAARGADFPDVGYANVGFRIVLAQVPPPPVFEGFDLVHIPSGDFLIGSPDDEADRDSDEGPQTRVTFTSEFWIGRYEVTQRDYALVIGLNPSGHRGLPESPVESVSWEEANEFCRRVTLIEQQAGRLPEGFVYRLPTEAEWEYAARAGTSARFSYGDDPNYDHLTGYAWFLRNSGAETHPVGRLAANPWGIHDVHGNVGEWTWDWYGNYPGGNVTNPTGPASGDHHVIRGGSAFDDGKFSRVAFRLIDWTSDRFSNVGFRVVLGRPLAAGP